MKKILAALVAIMLLAMPAAFAQEAFYFADPVLSMGEETNIDLTGLELCVAGEDGAAKLLINGNGETLFSVDVNMVGQTMLLTATGLSNVYSLALPESVGENMNGVLINLELPQEAIEQITGVVMGSIEIDEENGTVRIPYTAVNDVLEKVLPYLSEAQIPGFDLDGMLGSIAEMKDSDSGIDLQGTFDVAEDGSTSFGFSAFQVDHGTIADAPAFTMAMELSSENFALSIDAGDQGKLSFSVQKGQLTVAVDVAGIEIALTGKMGTKDVDVEFAKLDAASAIDAQSLSEEDLGKLSEEVMNGASDLIGFVMGALMGAAA